MINIPLVRSITITLSRPADIASVELAQPGEGVIAIRLLPDNRHLEVTYDLHKVTLPEVTARLSAVGMAPSDSLFARWSRAWITFKDENRRDQAKIAHQCCNVPPGDDSHRN